MCSKFLKIVWPYPDKQADDRWQAIVVKGSHPVPEHFVLKCGGGHIPNLVQFVQELVDMHGVGINPFSQLLPRDGGIEQRWPEHSPDVFVPKTACIARCNRTLQHPL
jgi:hypothetical protein